MKLCRYNTGNSDTFSHTPNAVRKLALSPLPLDIWNLYHKNVRLERMARSQRKIAIHPQQHQQHTGVGALAVC